jgi:preprotein translocase subunit SecD
MKNRATLHIQMSADDAKKFTALTEQAVGKQMLLMLGDTPLIAARVMTPITTQSLQLTFGEKSDSKKIEDALRRLTK